MPRETNLTGSAPDNSGVPAKYSEAIAELADSYLAPFIGSSQASDAERLVSSPPEE